MLRTILLIVVILLLLGALPTWPYSTGWGYYPSGGLTLLLIILIVELLNSAIEATVDRIGLERHVLAGLAKDIGSAAVMLSFILLGVVWLLVLTGRP